MALGEVSGVSSAVNLSRVASGAPIRVASASTPPGDPASRFVASDLSAPGDDPLRYERAVRALDGTARSGLGAAVAPGLTAPTDNAVGSALAAAVPTTVPAPQIGEAVRQAQDLTRFAAAWSDLPGYVAAVLSGSVKLPNATTVL